jgi:hypothetical protein
MVKPLLEEFDLARRLLLFCGATTYGLLVTGQAQIVDIRQEDPWGSVNWHLIAEIPRWFAPDRGIAGHALADTAAVR